ncbi:Coenzyme F420:L-glutamate ligase [Candidatus Methanoperedenaceae archaeon GB37]|nr:Coenzyme F420:L-glutamate ligase [Candidatus Methanoperedenaceae archaeon GB37]
MQQLVFIPVRTPILTPEDRISDALIGSMEKERITPEDGDIFIIAESAVATTEGRLVDLSSVTPTEEALRLAEKYMIEPREMELILREADEIIGGVPGVVLTITRGVLSPNTGIDSSNAPEGHVTLMPLNPTASAREIRSALEEHYGCRCAVIISDSRTQPLRLGTIGVALGCSGIEPVEDARGRRDLYGKPLRITQRAIADNLASAAQLLMGEASEGVPAVIARGTGLYMRDRGDGEAQEIPLIPRDECLFFGALRSND